MIGKDASDRVNGAISALAGATQESFGAVADATVATQRQNIKLLHGWVEGFFGRFGEQTEINQRTAQTLIEQSARQREALQVLARESARMWMAPFHVAVCLLRGKREAEKNGLDLPIKDYDQLSVEAIIGKLGGLCAGEVEDLSSYERRHKSRRSLLERFDRALV